MNFESPEDIRFLQQMKRREEICMRIATLSGAVFVAAMVWWVA